MRHRSRGFLATGLAAVWLSAVPAPARAGYVIDQKNNPANPTDSFNIQAFPPVGQSFTPSVADMNTVQLYTADGVNGNGTGATLSVSIDSLKANGDINAVLATSGNVNLADSFKGISTFSFAPDVTLTAGTLYLIQVNITKGSDGWYIYDTADNYNRGTEYKNGSSQPDDDLWFTEGETKAAPEPSSLLLMGLGVGGAGLYARRRRRRR